MKDVLVISSYRSAYELAPVNQEPHKYEDAVITVFVRNALQELYKEYQPFLGEQISRMLAYIALTDHLHSDEFIDDQFQLDLYRTVYRYWDVSVDCDHPSSIEFRDELRISTEHLRNQDFIDIRLKDELFEQWRTNFSSALEADDKKGYADRMQLGIRHLQEKIPPLMEGIPLNFVLGILSGALAARIPSDPVSGTAIGAVVGTGLEVVGRSMRRKQERNEIRAKGALSMHYAALLRSASTQSDSNHLGPENGTSELTVRLMKS